MFERGLLQPRFLNVFMQDETDAEAGQPGASIIKKTQAPRGWAAGRVAPLASGGGPLFRAKLDRFSLCGPYLGAGTLRGALNRRSEVCSPTISLTRAPVLNIKLSNVRSRQPFAASVSTAWSTA